ncbi:OmpH family outer membrane protein [uncultured Microscilla sp.]|uniref:OmpH family outer membrane protein n=1 Tax=uncultured Microscilla sp. TaxID=432653 RepID=UPI0026116519|nr:OmpH family outer membrane protein [uncultured Microscilla sp.]
MKNQILVIFNLLLLLGVIGYLALQPTQNHRIAYVRSAELMDKYLGVKEAQLQYNKQLTAWKIGADTLEKRVNATMNFISHQKNSLNDQQLKQLQVEMQRRRADLDRYQLNIQKKAANKEQKLFGGAVKQINSFVEQYAKEKGYSMVLGTTNTGNLMYGDKALDITEEVLTALNKSYKQ